MYYRKSNAIIVILLILIVLIIFAAGSELQKRPRTVYVTPPRPDAFIHSYYNYPQDENTVKTMLFLKNRGASGLITVEYNSVNGEFLEIREYYLKGGESKNFEEIWKVP
ncbi:MAG: hypothetical protein WBF08_07830, partial [Candidatus Bathyarchaeia archaeon]